MNESIFAKIVAGEVPCHKVYEDEKTLAFLDLFPKGEGHTLVIPKVNPAEFVWDLDDETYQAVMATAKKVALRLREVLPYEYVSQKVVGTDVPYAHVHLVPFTPGKSSYDGAQAQDETLRVLAEKLRFDD